MPLLKKIRTYSHQGPRSFNAHETHRLKELDGVELASFRSRAFAMLLDMAAIVGVVLVALAMVLAALTWISELMTGRSPEDWNLGISVNTRDQHQLSEILKLVIQFGVPILYWGLMTFFTQGQTIGKRLLSIRVVSTVGAKLTLWQCVERSVAYYLSAAEAGFGFMQYFINPNRRTVHDRVAETIVVKEVVVRGLKRKSSIAYNEEKLLAEHA